ncbi:hypothetical protein RUND412_005801 [Rhizina undulata]
MAKTAKLKTRTPSARSRAGRRQASPSIDLDKSLKSLPRPDDQKAEEEGLTHKDVLSKKVNAIVHRSDGVSKKRGHKVLSSKMRKRRDAAVEKAMASQEKLEKKRTDSLKKVKVVKERAAGWEDLNDKIETALEVTA